MRRFNADRPDCLFVISGRRLKKMKLPGNSVHLGYLDDEEMPTLVNSMDVVISVNRLSSFGEHSYPVKLYEAASCGVPFVATNTKASRWMTAGDTDCLYNAGDVDDLDRTLRRMLDSPVSPPGMRRNWEAAVGQLSNFFGSN